jgi:hypothetical protein
MEPYREADCGIFCTLHNAGYIKGTQVSALDSFVLVEMALTRTEHSCLAAFNTPLGAIKEVDLSGSTIAIRV